MDSRSEPLRDCTRRTAGSSAAAPAEPSAEAKTNPQSSVAPVVLSNFGLTFTSAAWPPTKAGGTSSSRRQHPKRRLRGVGDLRGVADHLVHGSSLPLLAVSLLNICAGFVSASALSRMPSNQATVFGKGLVKLDPSIHLAHGRTRTISKVRHILSAARAALRERDKDSCHSSFEDLIHASPDRFNARVHSSRERGHGRRRRISAYHQHDRTHKRRPCSGSDTLPISLHGVSLTGSFADWARPSWSVRSSRGIRAGV